MDYPTIWPQFFTSTIQNWKHLLKDDEYKDIIINCLQFLTREKRITLNAFTIMSNHVHIIWQPLQHYTLTQIQTSFSTQTSREIIKKLKEKNPGQFDSLKVNKYDRAYQVWKREPLSIELFTEKIFQQKLEYIHQNAVVAGLVILPEMYKYSSAKFYEMGIDDFNMLTHYMGS